MLGNDTNPGISDIILFEKSKNTIMILLEFPNRHKNDSSPLSVNAIQEKLDETVEGLHKNFNGTPIILRYLFLIFLYS